MNGAVRRHGAALVAVALTVGALTAVGTDWGRPSASSERDGGRPNIVVIYTDDQTVAQMEALPATRRFFDANGVRFADNTTTFPLCCPSRATLLTGMYTHNHGVNSNYFASGGGYRTFAQRDGDRSLAVALDQAGYHTGWLGKYLNEYGSASAGNSPTERAPGWDDWRPAIGEYATDYWHTRINDNGTVVDLSGRYQTDAYADIAGQMIDEAVGQPDPFFLVFSFFAPHLGVRVDGGATEDERTLDVAEYSPRYADAYGASLAPRGAAFNESSLDDKPAVVRDLYGPLLTPAEVDAIDQRWRSELRALRSVDDAFSEIRRTLSDAGALDDTVVVFTSDNGYMHGEHRIPSAKYVPYRESLEVPLYIADPGGRHGAVYRGLTANIDLAPTVLDYAHAEALAPVDGLSLRGPVTTGADLGIGGGRPILLHGGEAGVGSRLAGYSGVRWGTWVLWQWDSAGQPVEMYDLATDPDEVQNLADDPRFAATRAALVAMRDELTGCVGPTCRLLPARGPDGS